MLLSAVSILVVAQSSSEIPEGLMNNPVYAILQGCQRTTEHVTATVILLMKNDKQREQPRSFIMSHYSTTVILVYSTIL